jgi:hypothetical protein
VGFVFMLLHYGWPSQRRLAGQVAALARTTSFSIFLFLRLKKY